MIEEAGLKWLNHVTATNVAATQGTTVQPNYRRFVYYIKIENAIAGFNTVSVGMDNGALITLDTFSLTFLGDYIEYPREGITKDTRPLFILPAGYQISLVTNNGDAYFRMGYMDKTK